MTAPTGRPRGRPPKVSTERQDGPYENVFLAIGTRQDRNAYTVGRQARKLLQNELEHLYEGDGLCRRVIDLPAEEMMRAGYTINGIDDAQDVLAELDGIAADTHITDALRWSRLYGGSLIVMLIRDGGGLEQPLNEEQVKEIEQLRVYDRWQTSIFKRYTDPNDRRYGKPEIYHISPIVGMPYKVHESRCLVFDGQPVPARIREENEGWGASVVQQCFEQLNRVNLSHYWANGLIERAQQAVHGIPDLGGLLRSPGGEQTIMRRIGMVDMARSVNNTVVIDAAETYDLKSTSLASVPDLLDRLGVALCAVTGIPEALLFGKPQSGLNSTGKADLENWYAKVAQVQVTFLLPQLDRLVGLQLRAMGKFVEDYEVEFNPLFVPSAKDKAETGYKRAQTFEILHNIGALDASEVRKMLPDEGYEIEDPDNLPPPSDNDAEREALELEAMRNAVKAPATDPEDEQ